ncbi:MAG: plasmid mobilization relaxosome protein MobC [Clostridia bacterium]|nr:plasmid mobilization relaxosome protein MobC [Clostridia bacterium]
MSTKKTERLQLRLSPEEKEMLMKKAAESRMTVSDYLANLVANKKVETVKSIPALIYEIRKIGVNINQIAHIGNSQRYLDNNLLNKVIADMENVKTLVQKILAEVYNADEHSIGTLEQRINELIERVDNIGNGQGN